ncbi:MAG: DUF2796 domain-containing protein [Desulfovibrio sp.]
MKNLLALTACAVLMAAAPAFAHGPHEHGAARMDVAVEGNTVEISLESPLANALPFEHAPRDAAQRQAVRNMAATLRQAENIFIFPTAAQCRIRQVRLESEALPPALLEEGSAGQPEQAGQNAPAASTSASEPKGHEDHDGHDEHADLDASFTFECVQPDALHGVDVRLFSAWPALHELRVQIVSPTGQHAAELNEQAHTLEW